jgi:heptose I phosphotransferase
MDLHRVQIRRKVPTRWLLKDLAGLYFSAWDIGLTQRDLLTFVREYKGGLHDFCAQRQWWQRVEAKARRLYQKQHREKA